MKWGGIPIGGQVCMGWDRDRGQGMLWAQDSNRGQGMHDQWDRIGGGYAWVGQNRGRACMGWDRIGGGMHGVGQNRGRVCMGVIVR